MTMRRIAVGLFIAAAGAASTAAPASATEIPPINCGIVSCTDRIERAVESTEGLQECVAGAVRAVEYVLQGTPQPQECNPV
jgi:hypothetical protein